MRKAQTRVAYTGSIVPMVGTSSKSDLVLVVGLGGGGRERLRERIMEQDGLTGSGKGRSCDSAKIKLCFQIKHAPQHAKLLAARLHRNLPRVHYPIANIFQTPSFTLSSGTRGFQTKFTILVGAAMSRWCVDSG